MKKQVLEIRKLNVLEKKKKEQPDGSFKNINQVMWLTHSPLAASQCKQHKVKWSRVCKALNYQAPWPSCWASVSSWFFPHTDLSVAQKNQVPVPSGGSVLTTPSARKALPPDCVSCPFLSLRVGSDVTVSKRSSLTIPFKVALLPPSNTSLSFVIFVTHTYQKLPSFTSLLLIRM